MKESAIQKKILNHLEALGFFVIKNIVANKAGTPDIISCSPHGRFVAIEVKTEGGKLSTLQEVKIRKIKEANGIAFVAYGWDDFLIKFKHLQATTLGL